ncbi:uncharacterized protein K441DRAFT_692851 [Cenococcum geophilum 1.58]|uniref:uncharacterized protein n=1 Tax=Cenococcum geophilum 1.58 TaxID=794803 RepID=UPI00358F3525|nr:hypothetical protein K441DRAFT_692851 [Cenococcum geophilum 1.58]
MTWYIYALLLEESAEKWKVDLFGISQGFVLLHEAQHLVSIVGDSNVCKDEAYGPNYLKIVNADSMVIFALDVYSVPPLGSVEDCSSSSKRSNKFQPADIRLDKPASSSTDRTRSTRSTTSLNTSTSSIKPVTASPPRSRSTNGTQSSRSAMAVPIITRALITTSISIPSGDILSTSLSTTTSSVTQNGIVVPIIIVIPIVEPVPKDPPVGGDGTGTNGGSNDNNAPTASKPAVSSSSSSSEALSSTSSSTSATCTALKPFASEFAFRDNTIIPIDVIKSVLAIIAIGVTTSGDTAETTSTPRQGYPKMLSLKIPVLR